MANDSDTGGTALFRELFVELPPEHMEALREMRRLDEEETFYTGVVARSPRGWGSTFRVLRLFAEGKLIGPEQRVLLRVLERHMAEHGLSPADIE